MMAISSVKNISTNYFCPLLLLLLVLVLLLLCLLQLCPQL
jgi:hypothetical protein